LKLVLFSLYCAREFSSFNDARYKAREKRGLRQTTARSARASAKKYIAKVKKEEEMQP